MLPGGGRGLGRLKDLLASTLWFVPAVAALGAILLAAVTLTLDHTVFEGASGIFPGGRDAARSLLATIASAMITSLGVVFSITMVVLQLASNRFSPRVFRTFLQDRPSQLAMGAFVATFTFSLFVLLFVRAAERGQQAFVPGLSTVFSFVLVLASVGFFVEFVDHLARSMRISHITSSVGSDAAAAIERVHPLDAVEEGWTARTRPARLIHADRKGMVDSIDVSRVVSIASEADVVLVFRHMVGEFVPRGVVVVEVHGEGDVDERAVLEAVELGEERDITQDPAFGLRQLVDVAERSLSPGTVDPTSAAQALDQVHDLLRDLAGRPLPAARILRDAHGRERGIIPSMTWQAYLDLATDEVLRYGAESIQVLGRLRTMLEDLEGATSGGRREAVSAKLRGLPPPPDPYRLDHEDRAM